MTSGTSIRHSADDALHYSALRNIYSTLQQPCSGAQR